MKSLLKKIIPTRILDYRSKASYNKEQSPYYNRTVQDVFNGIYKENTWGNDQSISGQGSSLLMSNKAIQAINDVIAEYQPKSILDIPCGDFNWFRHIDLKNVDYTGADIVKELIDKNQEQFASGNIQFQHLNLIEDDLPPSDLVIVRDCFVHFSYADIRSSIANIKRANCKYLLVTTFTKQRINYDITTGDWRPVNLLKSPFFFPEPLFLAVEDHTPAFKKDFRGKSLALWRLADI